jgi:hypothetical protein
MSAAEHTHEDDVEVRDLLKVRRVEIVDAAGKSRISLGGGDDFASIVLYHPNDGGQTRPGAETGEEIDAFIELFAGDFDNGARAGIRVIDGSTHVDLDVVAQSIDHAEVIHLRKRVDRLEGILSTLAGAFGAIGVLHADDIVAEAPCPRCERRFTLDVLAAHVGSDDCDLEVAKDVKWRRPGGELDKVERGDWRPS